MSHLDEPRKVSAAEVEILGSEGQTIQKPEKQSDHFRGASFGGIRVIKGGPALLLILPLLIPIAIFSFFAMAVFALFFGRRVFRVFSAGIQRR